MSDQGAVERLRIVDQNARAPVVPEVHRDLNFTFNLKAEFAKQMILANGMFSARPAACRDAYQEMQLQPADEVVTRACDLAEAMFAEFERRGWLPAVPFHDEQVRQLEEAGDRRKIGLTGD